MVKMIFSDFDNTLLNYYSNKNYFDDYQINVLKRLGAKGIKFCIVTGRSVIFFKKFFNLLEVVDYIIGSNGACIYDVKNNKYIFQKSIENNDLEMLLGYFVKRKYSFLLNCLNKRYQFGRWSNVDAYSYEIGQDYKCEQVVLSFSKEYGVEVTKFLENLDNIVVNNVTDWGDKYSFDINLKSVSKGNTVSWLCDKLNIDVIDTVGFGDGINDFSLFKVVGKSVSVGNASDNVKDNTDEVTLCCEEDGVYKYIEQNILR